MRAGVQRKILDGVFLLESEPENVPKCREEVQGKKRLWVKKCLLKTVAFAVK